MVSLYKDPKGENVFGKKDSINKNQLALAAVPKVTVDKLTDQESAECKDKLLFWCKKMQCLSTPRFCMYPALYVLHDYFNSKRITHMYGYYR